MARSTNLENLQRKDSKTSSLWKPGNVRSTEVPFYEDARLKEAETRKKCRCQFEHDDKILMGWELYQPRTRYVHTNIRTKPSSTDTLRRLLTERIPEWESINGKPTILTRLIKMMQKPIPGPEYEYGNCLQQTLDFDSNTCKYSLIGKVEYTPPDIDEVYLSEKKTEERKRRNPYKEIQLCPRSIHAERYQPTGQEYVKRVDSLIEPTKL